MKHIGFTGTRHGLSARQRMLLRKLLKESDATHFHHGGCVGADEEAHAIAKTAGMTVVAHPSILSQWRGNYTDANVVRPHAHPLRRNKDIVEEVSEMIACPKERHEKLRSGTWATIRHARKIGRRLTIIDP